MRRLRFLLAAAVLLVGAAALLRQPAAQAEGPSNKEIVTSFYEAVFRDHRVEEGFAKYVGDRYVQHNPLVPDGAAAAIGFFVPFFAANPHARNEIKRVAADGDLVWLHVHSRQNVNDPNDRGRAIVDIFRVEDGKIVEHWDVIQPVPAQAANPNTMF